MHNGRLLNINGLHRALRYYFWELDSALRLALKLAALQAGILIDGPPEWDQLVDQLHNRVADPGNRDELSALGFSWHGVDLFEVRTYAELCRGGVLHVIFESSAEGQLRTVWLDQCRKGGMDQRLPDGLDRFHDSSKLFVQRLLRLSNRIKTASSEVSELV